MREETLIRAGRREWLGLVTLALPTLLVSIDVSVILLALPHLSSALGADGTQQLWIMDVYGFMLAGFMVTMGTLGDRIGRRKLLLAGAAAFTVASVVAAFSGSAGMLIAARALLGVAGATLTPSMLALISNMFTNPRQRAVAISVWLACFMSGMAIGPVVGGALLEVFWWGSVFLLGVPVMLVLLVAGPILLPEYRAPDAGRLDLTSVALSLAAILPAIYGLKELARDGWQLVPVLAVVAGAAFGAVFVVRQRGLRSPLLDLSLFRGRGFTVAVVSMLVVTATGAVMVPITQYFQLVQGLSPVQAGLCMLPGAVATVVGALLSPHIARKIPANRLISGGLLVSAAGLLLFTQVDGVASLIACFVLFNLGASPLVALSIDLIVGSAPLDKAGSAAAMGETSSEFGFALGIATLGSLGAAIYRGQVDTSADAARESLAGAMAVARNLPGEVGSALLTSARDAFTSGMHAVGLVCAVLMLGVALLQVRPVKLGADTE